MFYNDLVEANHQQDKSFHNGLVELKSWKCVSRHNGVHFFDISTPKSGPHLVCFVHFDLQMCFAPQRRALFRHLNFQKCSETQVFCTFSLGNVLRATTACNFSSLNWPAGSATAELAQRIWLKPGETVGISEIPNAVGKKLVFRGGSTGCERFNRMCVCWPASQAPMVSATCNM